MKHWKQKLTAGAVSLATLIPTARADGIADSTIGIGVKNLISDISSYLLILCPIAGGGSAIYFLIRRSMADEQDGKMWEKRVRNSIICGVAGMLVSGVIALLSSYF